MAGTLTCNNADFAVAVYEPVRAIHSTPVFPWHVECTVGAYRLGRSFRTVVVTGRYVIRRGICGNDLGAFLFSVRAFHYCPCGPYGGQSTNQRDPVMIYKI